MTKSLPAALIFVFLSLIPGWFALRYGAETLGFLSRAVETTGTINGYKWITGAAGGGSETAFSPLIRFKTAGGLWTEVPANVLTTNDADKIGEEVVVYYDPENTAQVRLGSFRSLYAATTLFAVPALILLFIGLFLYPIRGRTDGGK